MTRIVTIAGRDSVFIYEGYGRRVIVNPKVASIWHEHRQMCAATPESFGVLMGSASIDQREIWIQAVTTPMPRDLNSRNFFMLRDPGHQREVNRMFDSSNDCVIYLGTWHTHPEPVPAPSKIDRADWINCLRANRRRPLAFVIVGTKTVRVFVRAKWRFRHLQLKYEIHDIS